MKNLLLTSLFGIALSSPFSNIALASNCQGETVTCFDGCTGTNITAYNADTCEFTFDSSAGCNRGWGSCSDASDPCAGETVTCIDGCTGTNITAYNADTCAFTFDVNAGCNRGWGYCSN